MDNSSKVTAGLAAGKVKKKKYKQWFLAWFDTIWPNVFGLNEKNKVKLNVKLDFFMVYFYIGKA